MKLDEKQRMLSELTSILREYPKRDDSDLRVSLNRNRSLIHIAYGITRIADQGDSRPIPVTCSLFTIVKRIKEKLGDAEWGSDEHGAKMFNELIESEYDKLKEALQAHIHPDPCAVYDIRWTRSS